MEAHSDSLDRKWSVSLIQTKMMPPRLPPGCVQRPAMFERLRERGDGSITIVTAPAGFGKTTLLAGWTIHTIFWPDIRLDSHISPSLKRLYSVQRNRPAQC